MDRHTLINGDITATIQADGAELCSLRDADGNELLWQAGAIWPRHAPILFPIVGRLSNDVLHHGGRSYRLTQHGFARDQRFQWVDRAQQSCALTLQDSAETRLQYPFAFGLEVLYALEGQALLITYRLSNPGDDVLPASLGTHPAFNWPLAAGVAKSSHTLVFAAPEPAPTRRLSGGLLRAQPETSPIIGDTLHLSESLFADDAIILDQLASTSVRFSAPGGPAIDMSWDGFGELGIWSKPGGAFLCIEPWHGYASPVGFDGDFAAKPGLMHLAPGETRSFLQRIAIS